jgi:hypothetical protein
MESLARELIRVAVHYTTDEKEKEEIRRQLSYLLVTTIPAVFMFYARSEKVKKPHWSVAWKKEKRKREEEAEEAEEAAKAKNETDKETVARHTKDKEVGRGEEGRGGKERRNPFARCLSLFSFPPLTSHTFSFLFPVSSDFPFFPSRLIPSSSV